MFCDIQIDFKDLENILTYTVYLHELNVMYLPSSILEAFKSFHNSFVYWNHPY